MHKKLDKFHYHEALDRASLMSDFFDDHLLSHPAVEGTPCLSELATKISADLAELYQLAGKVAVLNDDHS